MKFAQPELFMRRDCRRCHCEAQGKFLALLETSVAISCKGRDRHAALATGDCQAVLEMTILSEHRLNI